MAIEESTSGFEKLGRGFEPTCKSIYEAEVAYRFSVGFADTFPFLPTSVKPEGLADYWKLKGLKSLLPRKQL